jgi:LmbE family N-acetylglucosaminyl deacetylase
MATILAVHAHPDDIEHLAAGALAILAAKGHAVRIATLTAGECGSAETDLSETARIRKAEAAAAAALIGAEYRCADLPDLGVFNDDPSRRAATELIRWARPDVVIAASPADYHPDHEAASLLVRDACFASSVPNYRTGPSAALEAIPHLYFMDPIGGRDREGHRIVADFGADIAAGFAMKQKMLAAHVSQAEWVARQRLIGAEVAAVVASAQVVPLLGGAPQRAGDRQLLRHP